MCNFLIEQIVRRFFSFIIVALKEFGFKPALAINVLASMKKRIGKDLHNLLNNTLSPESVKLTILNQEYKQASNGEIISKMKLLISGSIFPRPPAAVMFFNGDFGFCEILTILKKKYTIFLVYTSNVVSDILFTIANYHCPLSNLLCLDGQTTQWKQFDFTGNFFCLVLLDGQIPQWKSFRSIAFFFCVCIQ